MKLFAITPITLANLCPAQLKSTGAGRYQLLSGGVGLHRTGKPS